MALFGEGKGFRVTAAVTGENSVGVEAFARACAMGGMNGFAPGSSGAAAAAELASNSCAGAGADATDSRGSCAACGVPKGFAMLIGTRHPFRGYHQSIFILALSAHTSINLAAEKLNSSR